jgi:transcriptional regulator with XRE-family HTH domain
MNEKNPLSVAIGARLRAERHRAGLSLSKLGEQTGGQLSKSRISNYEQGLRRMGLEEAILLGRALNALPSYLLCLDEETLSVKEHDLIRMYRASDARGQKVITGIAEEESTRVHGVSAVTA